MVTFNILSLAHCTLDLVVAQIHGNLDCFSSSPGRAKKQWIWAPTEASATEPIMHPMRGGDITQKPQRRSMATLATPSFLAVPTQLVGNTKGRVDRKGLCCGSFDKYHVETRFVSNAKQDPGRAGQKSCARIGRNYPAFSSAYIIHINMTNKNNQLQSIIWGRD